MRGMTRKRQCGAAIGLVVLAVILLWGGMGLAFMGDHIPHWLHQLANLMMLGCVFVGGAGAVWLLGLMVVAAKDRLSPPRRPPA